MSGEQEDVPRGRSVHPRPPLRARPITSRSPTELASLAMKIARGLAAPRWNAREMRRIAAGRAAPPPRECFPDFLGIGTPQSGTTWLFDKLVRHPDIFIPERKEMEFFYWERTELHKRVLGLREYVAHYRGAGARCKGDLTPNYAVLPPERIRYIARLMTGARLILVLRDPVERSWSTTRRLLPRYFGGVPDDPQTIVHFLERESWIHELSDYPSIIDRWCEVFPRTDLLMVGFGAIQERPSEVLRAILGHIGVDAQATPEASDLEARGNPNPELAIPGVVEDYLSERYADVLREMERRGLET